MSYITLSIGEPSYREEVDDMLLVEKGFITNKITGFRILDVKHHKIKFISIVELKIDKILKKDNFPFRTAYLDALKQKFESARLKNFIYS